MRQLPQTGQGMAQWEQDIRLVPGRGPLLRDLQRLLAVLPDGIIFAQVMGEQGELVIKLLDVPELGGLGRVYDKTPHIRARGSELCA